MTTAVATNYCCAACGHVASARFGICGVCRSIGTARLTDEVPNPQKFRLHSAIVEESEKKREKKKTKETILEEWIGEAVEKEAAMPPPERPPPTRSLRISDELDLPIDVATETVAVLAKRGSGKTYFACVLVEEFARLGIPIVIIDPVGAMWGLSKNEDGRGEGLEIEIWGGEHATEEKINFYEDGERLARLAVTTGRRTPLLLDLSDLRVHERTHFACSFFEELYRLKNDSAFRTPLHVMVDEADLFAPQSPVDDRSKRMLLSLEDIVRRGRSRGLGGTFITQRPSVLHKNILSQTQVLVAFRLTSPHDRDAIDEWIKTNGEEYERAALLSSLPVLEKGQAWFWSPGWKSEDAPEGLFKKVRVRRRRTFDSSATPRVEVCLGESQGASLLDNEDPE